MNDVPDDTDPLPAGWWKNEDVCRELVHAFSRHIVGLHLTVEINGKIKQDISTGFVLYYRQRAMWATAGHVVDDLMKLLDCPDAKIRNAAWLDGCQVPGAEWVPAVGLRESAMCSATRSGIDFGVIDLNPVFTMLSANRDLRIMTDVAWLNNENVEPEGYYVVGFPAEWHRTSSEVHGKRVYTNFAAALACIPIERVKPEHSQENQDFWQHPTSLYGRVLSTYTVRESRLDSIVGVSGGPVLSVERFPGNRIKYRLFGIQSEWLPQSRIVRAESMGDIVALMDGVDVEHKNEA